MKEEKMAEIALRNVCKQFNSKQYGVKDFNLDIHDKEFVIFVGPSGCGKSTTLRLMENFGLMEKFATIWSQKKEKCRWYFKIMHCIPI